MPVPSAVDYTEMYDADYWRRPDRFGSSSFSDADDIVDRIVRIAGPCRILDVGCGMGRLTLALLRRGFDAVGVDVSSVAIDEAATIAPGRFRAASALDLPFADNSFSTVISTDFLEHLHEADVDRALSEMRRVCAETLYLHVATTPDRDRKWHLTIRSREWWERQILMAGFRKHPRYIDVAGYEEVENEGSPVAIAMQPVPAAAHAEYPLSALAAERGLHMDMNREVGRRSDAHIVRYRLARDYVRPGDTVLNLACGPGYGAASIAYGSGAARVIGVDNSQYAIEYAKRNYSNGVKGRLEFYRADACALKWLADESIDFAVSMDTLEYMEDPEAFLTEMTRILKPSGRIIASAPNMWVDETGRDPNPRRLHVYDLDKLAKQIGSRFLVETIWAQIAGGGGGTKLTDSVRSLREVNREADPPDAEWWICMAMKSPLGERKKAYKESIVRNPRRPGSRVADFASWYRNPYVFHGLMSRGFRLDNDTLLVLLARELADSAESDSADGGGALCVIAYRYLERVNGDYGHAESWSSQVNDLLFRIDDYLRVDSENPHVARWKISLSYVQGMLKQARGDIEGAKEAFDLCLSLDPLAFSPLIATKTVAAGYALSEILICRNEVKAAKATLRRTVQCALTAVGADWSNVVGDSDDPFIFGFGELREVCNAATKCALLLEGITRGWSNSFSHIRAMDRDSGQRLDRTEARIGERNTTIRMLNARISMLRRESVARDSEMTDLHARISSLTERGGGFERALAERDSRIAALEEAVAEERSHAAASDGMLSEILKSTSWRLTGPLRRTVDFAKRRVLRSL